MQELTSFNSTRCIRNLHGRTFDLNYQEAFNSTRCIRNLILDPYLCFSGWLLSTPHGALGTPGKLYELCEYVIAFNSTRCIRNRKGKAKTNPTGRLTFNSTRCIRNIVLDCYFNQCFYTLSTPHGALGTSTILISTGCGEAFNSTRCIRNGKVYELAEYLIEAFNSTRCIRNILI